jgi:hypothetical protein
MVEPDEGFINHPTPKPKHFIKEILQMTTNSTLDIFRSLKTVQLSESHEGIR